MTTPPLTSRWADVEVSQNAPCVTHNLLTRLSPNISPMDIATGPIAAICVIGGALLIGLVFMAIRRTGVPSWCRRLFASREKKPKPDLPRSIQQALAKLEAVTEKRPNRNPLTEAEDAECPICLARLYPQEAQTSTPAAAPTEDLESGLGAPAKTTATVNITTPEAKDQPIPPVDDEAVMLKQCNHIFHSRCLASWYLRKNYSCPVCRASYRRTIQQMEIDESLVVPAYLPPVAFW
ncbi:hypothetical protein Hte_007205 [Hypoxylon texense]